MIPKLRYLLLGCSAIKRPGRWPARDLYSGELYRAGRRYAEAQGARWLIYSGLHGLIEPDTLIESYDQRLPGVRDAEARHALLARLAEQVRGHLLAHPAGLVYELHAGAPYALALRQAAPTVEVEEPLAGLQIGQRKRWYAQRAGLLPASGEGS